MAAAKNVVGGDEQALTWLEILDTDGVRWKYNRAGAASSRATVHIYQHDDATLEILRDGAGRILLRQEGPGLPVSMNVHLAPSPSVGPGLGAVAGWGDGDLVYEQA
jgi:hypothetical protein